jgi:hypothetical protein
MASSWMLPRVALVGSGVSEKLIVSIIKMKIIGELGITLAVNSKRRTTSHKTPFLHIPFPSSPNTDVSDDDSSSINGIY